MHLTPLSSIIAILFIILPFIPIMPATINLPIHCESSSLSEFHIFMSLVFTLLLLFAYNCLKSLLSDYMSLHTPFSRYPACNSTHSDICYYPVYHAIHLLSICLIIIILGLLIVQPMCTSHPPTYSSSRFIFPPIPHSSVCQCLDSISCLNLINSFQVNKLLYHPPKSTSFLLCCLLLLAGDVEINPGPSLFTSLKCAHLNIHSATTVTISCDKPTLLRELISDQNLDILTLSETWLTKDTLPSVLNSLTPLNYSILHIPRPADKIGGGVAIIYRSFLKATIIPYNQTIKSFE